MGRLSFHKHEITHKSKKMKLFAALAAAASAQQAGTPVMPMMPAMPAMPAMGGMNPLMLSMLLDDSTRDYDRTKLEKICDDAAVDCKAHFDNIFQPIEVRFIFKMKKNLKKIFRPTKSSTVLALLYHLTAPPQWRMP